MTVGIISPSSIVKEEYIDDAAHLLRQWGVRVKVYPHAKGPASGTYAASWEDRRADLTAALAEPNVDMILCARGGYGAVQLLEAIDTKGLKNSMKPIIGFSDITALHACWQHCGVPSLHASMAKLFSEHGDNPTPSLAHIKEFILGKSSFEYEVPGNERNIPGTATGRLVGGNWAVLGGLMGTKYDMLTAYPGENLILFIEDISEPIYRVDRLLHQLFLHENFPNVKGLIFGNFSNYKPDANFSSMESMISENLKKNFFSLPVCYHFPIGHEGENLPMIVGSHATLSVENITKISMTL